MRVPIRLLENILKSGENSEGEYFSIRGNRFVWAKSVWIDSGGVAHRVVDVELNPEEHFKTN
jgi:hypothetical protein